MSSAYHLKMDAHTKRTNCTLEDMLKMYVSHQQWTWELEFVYNGSWHSCIKTSSLHVLYGWEYLILLFISTPISKIKGVNEMIANMQYILKLVKKSMQNA